MKLFCLTLFFCVLLPFASYSEIELKSPALLDVQFDRPQNVLIAESIKYDLPDDCALDLYVPKNAKNAPCILAIHGGGWHIGNEKKYAMMSAFFAKNGFVVACITYRKVPNCEISDCVIDAKKALCWLKKHAKEVGGNPDKIGVIGGSAGGHLTLMLAGDTKNFEGDIFSKENLNSSIQAAVGMAGAIDAKRFESKKVKNAKELDPSNYITKNNPPTLLLHSERERTVPYASSVAYDKKCKEIGVDCTLITYDSDNHAFWNVDIEEGIKLKSLQDALNFFNKILK